MDRDTAVILTQSKSTGVAVLLTILFGGIGLFYTSTQAGIWMTIIEFILITITIFTLGIGVILLVPFHIACLIMAISGVKKSNANLLMSTIPETSPEKA